MLSVTALRSRLILELKVERRVQVRALERLKDVKAPPRDSVGARDTALWVKRSSLERECITLLFIIMKMACCCSEANSFCYL